MRQLLLWTFFLQFSFFIFSQSSETEKLPAELLFKKSQQSRFSISPDGKYFAEVVKNNREIDLVIIDIEAYQLYKRIPLGKIRLSNVYWLSNNRLLYESVGEIYAIDKDGSNVTILVNNTVEVKKKKTYVPYYKRVRYNKVLGILPEKKDEILIETFDHNGYASVNIVNVFTGEKSEVVSGSYHKMNGWYLDKKGKPVIGIKEDEESWTYYVEDKNQAKWVPLKIVIDDNELLFITSASSYLNQNLTLEGIGYEPNIIYISSNVNTDKRELYKYDYQNKKIVSVLAKDVNCDISDPEGEDMQLIFDNAEKELAGVRYEGIMPQYQWKSKKFEKIFDIINNKYNKYFNDLLDYDAKNERFLLKQWSDVYAGNIGVYDIRDSTYKVMFHVNEELNKFELSRTRNISLKNRDGVQLLGYLNLPTNYIKEKNVPLVTIPHGGPWARDYWQLDGFSQFFASRGYAVLRVNYRGSIGFGKEHVLGGVDGISTVMIDDIVDATNYIKENYSIDSKNVFVFGHSYGGYAAYMSLIKYKDIFKSGVALSAPTDIKSWMKSQKKENNQFVFEFWKTALGDRDIKYLGEISPINFVDEISAPMLVFHGRYDPIVPVEQAERMKKKFEDSGRKDKFSILQNEGHTIWDSNSIGYILEQSDEFFRNKP